MRLLVISSSYPLLLRLVWQDFLAAAAAAASAAGKVRVVLDLGKKYRSSCFPFFFIERGLFSEAAACAVLYKKRERRGNIKSHGKSFFTADKKFIFCLEIGGGGIRKLAVSLNEIFCLSGQKKGKMALTTVKLYMLRNFEGT